MTGTPRWPIGEGFSIGLLWSMLLSMLLGCQAIYPDLTIDESTDSGLAEETGTATSTAMGTDSNVAVVGTDDTDDTQMTGTGTVTNIDTASASDAESDADTSTSTTGSTDADTATEVDTKNDADTGNDTGADTQTAAGTDEDSETQTHTPVDTGGDTVNDSNTDTGTETGADTDSAADSGSESAQDTSTVVETDTDTSPTTDCSGRADFTPCIVTTSPEDRAYDICIDGMCQSPGCGDSMCNAPGPHFPLADSGLTDCYTNSAQQVCTALDALFDGQDAQFGWDSTTQTMTRFTKSTDTSGYPVVQDNVTGLMWQGCAVGLTGNSCNSSSTGEQLTWLQAVDRCDMLDWAGYDDWHLPDVYEFVSILDLSATQPALATDIFPGTPATGTFWTATSHGITPDVRWEISSANGDVYTPSGDDTTAKSLVRCVRGGPVARPTRRFSISDVSGQPLVVDNVTELMWPGCHVVESISDELECSAGNTAPGMDWQTALGFCQTLVWGGETDWRLPNIKELHSIVDYRQYNPTMDTETFTGMPPTRLWTSTTRSSVVGYAWYVNMLTGQVGNVLKTGTESTEGSSTTYQHAAFCVRDN